MADQEIQQSSGAKPGFFYGYVIVAAAFSVMITAWGTYYAFGIFFKPMLTEFGWTRAIISGAFSIANIMRGLLGIVVGGLNDRLGPRVVITLCGFLIGLGYLLMSQVSTVWQLYVFYGVIIGIGMSGFWVPLLSTIVRWFDKRRSMMSGIVLTATGVGILIGAPVANRIISTYDWRISYIIMGSLVLIVILLAAQFLKRDPAQVGQMPDGEKRKLPHGLKSATGDFSLKEAVYTRQFWLYCAINFCFGFSVFTITVHIVPHAIELGISAASAATILATIGGLSIAGRLVLGSAGDRIGNRQVYIIGFIIMSISLFWLAQASQLWMLYVSAGLFGFAQGGMGTIGAPLLATLFGLTSHGLIFGVANLGFTTGAAFGPFLAGYIFDVTGNYQMAFLISAAASIVSLILAVLLKPIKEKHGQNGLPSTI